MQTTRQQAHCLNMNSIDGLHANKYPDGNQANRELADAAHEWIPASALFRAGSWYSFFTPTQMDQQGIMMTWVHRNGWLDYVGMEGITVWLNGRLHQGKLA